MPLTLPPGSVAVPTAADLGPNTVLASGRVTDYRFELLSNEEGLLGELTSVESGGSLSWDATASIKGGGSITVTDTGADIDWLNVRIRPVVLLERANGGATPIEVPLGVFIPSAPVEAWSAVGRAWNVELLDKNLVLDQDLITNALTGDALTYQAASGANVVDLIIALIQGAGESTAAISPQPYVLYRSQFWDMGTSRLKIINDLLETIGFYTLWVDGAGQYQVTEQRPPEARSPVYALLAPFIEGPTSLYTAELSQDRDYFSVPNRYIVIGQGDATTPPWTAVAEDNEAGSPFSFISRGRWISAVETGVETASLENLQALAVRRLAKAQAVSSRINVNHAFLPDLKVNTVVRFYNVGMKLDQLAVVNKTMVALDPVALCTSEMTLFGPNLWVEPEEAEQDCTTGITWADLPAGYRWSDVPSWVTWAAACYWNPNP